MNKEFVCCSATEDRTGGFPDLLPDWMATEGLVCVSC